MMTQPVVEEFDDAQVFVDAFNKNISDDLKAILVYHVESVPNISKIEVRKQVGQMLYEYALDRLQNGSYLDRYAIFSSIRRSISILDDPFDLFTPLLSHTDIVDARAVILKMFINVFFANPPKKEYEELEQKVISILEEYVNGKELVGGESALLFMNSIKLLATIDSDYLKNGIFIKYVRENKREYIFRHLNNHLDELDDQWEEKYIRQVETIGNFGAFLKKINANISSLS